MFQMPVKTKIRRNSHTKKSNIADRFYHIITKLYRKGLQPPSNSVNFNHLTLNIYSMYSKVC